MISTATRTPESYFWNRDLNPARRSNRSCGSYPARSAPFLLSSSWDDGCNGWRRCDAMSPSCPEAIPRMDGIRWINRLMTHPHPSLPSDITIDFILYPTSDELRQSPGDPLVLAKGRRAATLYFDILRAVLTRHGHQIDLDRIEHHPAIGWLIHYRARDPITITMLHDIAAGDPGPSDPVELGVLVTQTADGESPSV